jgi:hypothetical protein
LNYGKLNQPTYRIRAGEGEALANFSPAKRGGISQVREEERGPPGLWDYGVFNKYRRGYSGKVARVKILLPPVSRTPIAGAAQLLICAA